MLTARFSPGKEFLLEIIAAGLDIRFGFTFGIFTFLNSGRTSFSNQILTWQEISEKENFELQFLWGLKEFSEQTVASVVFE